MEFRQILQNLMKERGISMYRISKEIGCSQSAVKYWLDGSTMPQNRTLNALADMLGVRANYLRGIEDEYGLTSDDWRTLGTTYEAYRMSVGATVAWVALHTGVSEGDIMAFENDGVPIEKKELVVMCGVLNGATLDDVFHGYAKFFDKGAKESIPQQEYREALSESGVRILLDANSKLTKDDVREIAEFIKFKQQRNDRT